MISYKELMEGFPNFAKKKDDKKDDMDKEKEASDFDMKWKDIKNRHIKKEAGKLLKALDKKEILGYSAEHGEFTVFKDEMEYIQAGKGKGKKMKWVRVESKNIMKYIQEAFNFKGAVKTKMLDKTDKRWVDDLEKKGWEIEDFILSSKGYEITIKKGSKEARYIGKTPDKALIQAAKKAK